eukprot:CAMPEP_0168321264 /NCGR_PEP_ID=MMETSP0213-20121227/2165_1 /TAXON_ID=151035 /ORGANISM="Euplotes harpa, Strain FSP1.4" /LENGTH=238 /DNA_ID=CAMNT_0008322877 /DNA_START=130 /DNA_END=843 /DNA_ORIENTATION=-
MRRIMDNYSVEYPEKEESTSPDKYSTLPKLKPGKQNLDTVQLSRTLNRKGLNFSRAMSNVSSKDSSPPSFKSIGLSSFSKHQLGKRSASTYESHFNTIQERRSQSKAVEEMAAIDPVKSFKVKNLARFYRQKYNVENGNLNKTVEGIKLTALSRDIKNKNSLLKDQLSFLKTNIDRPKVVPLQDTLHGVLETNLHLKNEQRQVNRFKRWGGIKIPIGSNNIFNKCKDKINMWDECRDG